MSSGVYEVNLWTDGLFDDMLACMTVMWAPRMQGKTAPMERIMERMLGFVLDEENAVWTLDTVEDKDRVVWSEADELFRRPRLRDE